MGAVIGPGERSRPTDRPPRALIIDDDQATREILRDALVFVGFDVTVAADGVAGFAAITTGPPDLVLFDLMMPGLDGFELARRVRENPVLAGVALIAMSAGGHEARTRDLAAGRDAYLDKPFDLDDLERLVRTRLGG